MIVATFPEEGKTLFLSQNTASLLLTLGSSDINTMHYAFRNESNENHFNHLVLGSRLIHTLH
jgi:hypothetical protein